MTDVALTCPGGDTPEGANETGAFVLSWKGADGAQYRLVEAPTRDALTTGRVLYEGPDVATTVTGRTEGPHWYAVGRLEPSTADAPSPSVVGAWSEPCLVLVRPYPLEVAGIFFAFGLVVSVATALLVVRGHRAHKRGSIG